MRTSEAVAAAAGAAAAATAVAEGTAVPPPPGPVTPSPALLALEANLEEATALAAAHEHPHGPPIKGLLLREHLTRILPESSQGGRRGLAVEGAAAVGLSVGAGASPVSAEAERARAASQRAAAQLRKDLLQDGTLAGVGLWSRAVTSLAEMAMHSADPDALARALGEHPPLVHERDGARASAQASAVPSRAASAVHSRAASPVPSGAAENF